MRLFDKHSVSSSAQQEARSNPHLGLQRLALLGALGSWIALLLLGVAEQSLNLSSEVALRTELFVKGLFFNSFIFSTYAYNWLRVRQEPMSDFFSYLWHIFITAGLCVLASGLLSLPLLWLESSPFAFKVLVESLIFHTEFGLMVWLMMVSFAKWKKAVLYESAPLVKITWTVFEYGLMASTVTHFFVVISLNAYFYLVYAAFIVVSLVLCVNLRWIPRLAFKQKLLSMPLLLAVIVCFSYFVRTMAVRFSQEALVVDDISKSIFVAAMLTFDVGYALVSLLAILFNLPTASAFERRFIEMVSMQRLYDLMASGKSRKEVYGQLLEQAVEAGRANAGWLESPHEKLFICYGISQEDAISYLALLRDKGYNSREFKAYHHNFFSLSGAKGFRSILAIPLKAGQESLGTLVLLKKRADAFDASAITFANTLAAHAGIAMQNLRLTEQAMMTQAFQDGIKAIHGLKGRLLPPKGEAMQGIQMHIMSQAADSGGEGVGGDYYDFFPIKQGVYAFVIADVAGHGLTAAFSMAQLKGIFQALVRMGVTPAEFMRHANAALTKCLEKNTFVTAIYYLIDIEAQKISFSRAGHCPAFLCKANGEVAYLQSNGLGMGILPEEKYEKFIEVCEVAYMPGDLLINYTDGMIEATNRTTGEEYGYKRLHSYLGTKNNESLPEMATALMEEIHEFADSRILADDCTLVLMRMEPPVAIT